VFHAFAFTRATSVPLRLLHPHNIVNPAFEAKDSASRVTGPLPPAAQIQVARGFHRAYGSARAMKVSKRESNALLPRFRVMHLDEPALGPGKADLLMHLHETGSIVHAAEKLGMSYMRAWRLIQTMNRCFKEPLVQRQRGGKTGGGAALTPTGQQVLKLYRRIEAQSLKATNNTWKQMKTLLR
jgi:molybdate transport system regulatory protein